MKIVVLAGGLSTERQVALTSGTGVCRALRERGHQAILVDMFLGLESYEGRLEDIFDAPDGLCGDNRVTEEAPDLEAVRRSRKDQGPSLLGKDVLAVCAMADIVFLALHGSCGEDGRIQATLDLLGVPYTGSGYLGSGMAMDKSVTKRFLESKGIRTAPWRDVHYTASDIPRLVEELEVPCAVKIVNGGSSIGVELPDTKEQLGEALAKLLTYGDHVVVEKKIKGREIQIAVLDGEALPSIEIIPKKGFYDYANKYQPGAAEEVCAGTELEALSAGVLPEALLPLVSSPSPEASGSVPSSASPSVSPLSSSSSAWSCSFCSLRASYSSCVTVLPEDSSPEVVPAQPVIESSIRSASIPANALFFRLYMVSLHLSNRQILPLLYSFPVRSARQITSPGRPGRCRT